MMLAGVPVHPAAVEDLAYRLHDAGDMGLAERLTGKLERGVLVMSLEVGDRESILGVLTDCPDGLAELRAVLLRDHMWRQRGESIADKASDG